MARSLLRGRRAQQILLTVVGSTAVFSADVLRAVDATWSSTVGGTWSDGPNWIGGSAPGSSDQAIFSNNGAAQTVTVVGTGNTVQQLLFNSTAIGAFQFNPSTSTARINLSAGATGGLTLVVDANSANHTIASEFRTQGTGNSQTWQINGARTFTLNGTLSAGAGAGTHGLIKTGTGTLVLAGQSTGSFSGDLVINAGTVVLDYRTNDGNKLNNGLTLAGGSVSVLGLNAGVLTQSITGITIGSGLSLVAVTAGLNNGATFSLGSFTRTVAGGVVNFSKTNNGSGVATISTTSSNSTSVLGGYALFGNNNWATGGSIGAFSGYAFTDDMNNWTAGQNISDSAGFTNSVSTLSINTLRFNAAVDSTATINSVSRLTLSTGGILVSSNVGAHNSRITGGSIASNNGFDFIVHQNNGSGTLTIDSVLTGSGIGLTKAGDGTLVLTADNTFTGPVFIHGGAVRASSTTALGTGGAVTVNRGILEIGGVTISAPNLTLNDGARLRASGAGSFNKSNFPSIGAGASVEFAAPLAGDALTVVSSVRNGSGGTITVSGNGTVTQSNGSTGADAFSGTWVVSMGSTGIFKLSDGPALGNNASTPASAIVSGGALVSNTVNPIPNALTLAGGSLAATGASRVFSGPITLKTLTTSALSLVDPSNGTTPRGLTLSGAIGGSGHLNISGTGSATFTADNNYTGNTTITGGSLTLVSSTSTNNIASSPIVTVQSGAALDVSGITAVGNFKLANGQKLRGGGSVYGTFTADAGSTVAPGTSAGKLTFAGDGTNITLHTDSTYEVEIGGDGVGGAGVAGTDFDQIVVSGSSKTLNLGSAKLKILPMPNIVTGTPYRIVATSGGAGVTASSIFRNLAGNLDSGGPYSDGPLTFNIAYGYGGGGFVDVTFTSVPEPASVGVLMGCGLLLQRRRRRA